MAIPMPKPKMNKTLGSINFILKENYSSVINMISGPSKRKITCPDPNKKLLSNAVNNQLFAIEISEFTSHISVSYVPISLQASCSENLHSNLKTEYNFENKKSTNNRTRLRFIRIKKTVFFFLLL